jgi:hypothetical protein
MSKRKLSFKEREELIPKVKPEKEKKTKERLNANLSNDALKPTEKNGPREHCKELSTLAPTDWSVIPAVDWSAMPLPPFERCFLQPASKMTKAAPHPSECDAAHRLEHAIDVAVLPHPNRQPNDATLPEAPALASLPALPYFATFADERIPVALRQYLALQSTPSSASEAKPEKVREFSHPTAVQAQAWPLALMGENFVATAQTGR